jgi:hypothetical protein
MVDLAHRSKIDAFSSSGDLHERESTPFERKTYKEEFILPMADVAPSIYVRGNHDQQFDCENLSKLKSRLPIYVEEKSSVIRIAGAAIAALAWPERSSLLPAFGNRENTYENLYDATLETLRQLGTELVMHDGPKIFLSHLMVEGSVYSPGQPTIVVPISIKPQALAKTNSSFGVLVHVDYAWDNEEQVFRDGDRLVVPGALPALENSEVRVRYRVDKDQREAADRVAQNTRQG